MKTFALALIMVAAMVAPALAQDTRAPNRPTPRPTPGDVTEHNFTDADEVLGETVGAWNERIQVRQGRGTRSLIRHRTHFIDALYGSVERL